MALLNNEWAVLAFALLFIAFSIFLEKRYKWAGIISAASIMILGAIACSFFKLIPEKSVVYDVVNNYLLLMAIPMLLFTADLKKIVRQSGKLIIIYHFCALGSLIGAVIAALFFKNSAEVPGITAMAVGGNAGGAVNIVAMINAFNVSDSTASAATVILNVIMALTIIFLMSATKMKFFRKAYELPYEVEAEKKRQYAALSASEPKDEGKTVDRSLSVYDIVLTLGVGIVLCAVTVAISNLIGSTNLPLKGIIGNKYLIISFITVIGATLFPNFFGKLKGASEIGGVFIYLFFFTIGATASVSQLLKSGAAIIVISVVSGIMNLVVALLFGKLFKYNLEEILITVNATIGGPTTASGMAVAKGWESLTVPALLVGIYGYAIGNYISYPAGALVAKLLGA